LSLNTKTAYIIILPDKIYVGASEFKAIQLKNKKNLFLSLSPAVTADALLQYIEIAEES